MGFTYAVAWHEPRNEPPPCSDRASAKALQVRTQGSFAAAIIMAYQTMMVLIVFAETVMGILSLVQQGQPATDCFRSDGSPMVTPGSSMVSWGSTSRVHQQGGGS